MLDLLIPRSLMQIIDKPTQRAGHILDWVITEDSSIISDVYVVDKAVSDHSVITFNINKFLSSSNKRSVRCRNIKGINCDSFKCDLGQCNLELRADQERADYFNTFVQGVVDKHAPLRERTVTNRASAPWMNADIKKLKAERRAAERKWRKTRSTEDKNNFKCFNYKVKQCIQASKRFFFESKISISNSSKVLFNIVNELYGKSKCLKLPSNLPVSELADKFSSFFTNKISCIREQLDLTCVSNPFFGNLCSNKMNVFKNVTSNEVKEIILSSPSKSCALDPLPTTLLKVYIDSLIEPITEIINYSLHTGVVPACFKHALVTPLLKKPTLNPDILSNFRPVSNLSFISKILEKVVYRQMNTYLQSNGLLESFQSAYRKMHNTETALVKIINDLLVCADQRKVSILVLLDLSAAFDTIDHSILLDRLKYDFGFDGIVLNWFTSYLTNRTQSVSVKNSLSSKKLLSFGVPQGSVLGPILYSLYTTPLGSIINSFNLQYHMYADDTQIYMSVEPPQS